MDGKRLINQVLDQVEEIEKSLNTKESKARLVIYMSNEYRNAILEELDLLELPKQKDEYSFKENAHIKNHPLYTVKESEHGIKVYGV